jgi:hypothetical protein
VEWRGFCVPNYLPYIEPIRNLRLYNLGARQAKQKPWHSQYHNRDITQYIEPIRNLRLYNLGVRQAKQKPWHSQYPNRDITQYIEPIRNLRLYNLGVRQAKQKPWHSQYHNRDIINIPIEVSKYPDRGVVPRWGYHFTGYPDWAVQSDCQTGHLESPDTRPTTLGNSRMLL